jgi:hypothetical protein
MGVEICVEEREGSWTREREREDGEGERGKRGRGGWKTWDFGAVSGQDNGMDGKKRDKVGCA